MANYFVSSRLRFAGNIILVENMQFRSSPLLVAAKRYHSVFAPKKLEQLPEFLNCVCSRKMKLKLKFKLNFERILSVMESRFLAKFIFVLGN